MNEAIYLANELSSVKATLSFLLSETAPDFVSQRTLRFRCSALQPFVIINKKLVLRIRTLPELNPVSNFVTL